MKATQLAIGVETKDEISFSNSFLQGCWIADCDFTREYKHVISLFTTMNEHEFFSLPILEDGIRHAYRIVVQNNWNGILLGMSMNDHLVSSSRDIGTLEMGECC